MHTASFTSRSLWSHSLLLLLPDTIAPTFPRTWTAHNPSQGFISLHHESLNQILHFSKLHSGSRFTCSYIFKSTCALQYKCYGILRKALYKELLSLCSSSSLKTLFPFSTVNTLWLHEQLTTAERTGTIVGTWLSPSISNTDNSLGKQELSQNNFRSKY